MVDASKAVHTQSLLDAAATFRDADRAWRAARKATLAASKDDDAPFAVEIDAHRVRQAAIRTLLRVARSAE